ncbi:hypothetical protein B0T24DRAFT_683514 [Lasiosphaeria ovina]|uniref:Uncharacterized protein n=1 Tax=Lasiosphaeria ovina TaxID=92902 RepID=A0AAE0MZ32_9PEZI|nr:hypothetical protein B0T24DRAFT_683514 [Lasiosphaeria ovina]
MKPPIRYGGHALSVIVPVFSSLVLLHFRGEGHLSDEGIACELTSQLITASAQTTSSSDETA